jgi:transposase
LFEVNVSSITRFAREYAENGEIKDPAPHKSTFRKVSPDELRNYVNEHSDAYRREIAARFNCSQVGVLYALQRLEFTRKKDQNL